MILITQDFLFFLLSKENSGRANFLNQLCRMTFQWETAGCFVSNPSQGARANKRIPYLEERMSFLFGATKEEEGVKKDDRMYFLYVFVVFVEIDINCNTILFHCSWLSCRRLH